MSEGSGGRQLRQTAIYLVPVMLGALAPLAALPLITRAVSEAEYGAWAFATVYGVFLSGLANIGLPLAFERNFFEHRSRAGVLLYTLMAFASVTLVACGAVTWMFRAQLGTWFMGFPAGGSLMFWCFCAAGLSSLKSYYLIYLKNQDDAARYVAYSVDETVLGAVLSVAFVVWPGRLGATGLALAQTAASGAVLVLVASRFRRTAIFGIDAGLLREALRLGYPLTPRFFLGALSSNFDKYILGVLSSLGAVGIYALGQRISNAVWLCMNALENVYAPEVYRRLFDGGDSRGAIGRYLTPYAWGSAGLALCAALFAEEAVTLLTPPAFRGAIPVAALLALSYALLFFAKQKQLIFAKRTGIASMLATLTLLLNVAFTFVLARRWGATGAAAGTLLGGVVAGAIGFRVREHYCPIPWEYRRVAVVFGLLSAGTLLTVALFLADVPYWPRLFVKVATIAAFIYSGVRFDIVTPASLQALARALRIGSHQPAPGGIAG